MLRRLKSGVESQKGAVMIIEATFVFPIMFFIVFFMIMAGNIYFQQARVERIVTEAALEAASKCENPMLDYVKDKAIATDPDNEGIKPYRYIFSGYSSGVCSEVEESMEKKITDFGALGFAGMEAQLDSGATMIKPHIYMITGNVEAVCKFRVDFPIKMIFFPEKIGFDYRVCINQPISDPAELVRNVSTVADALERNEQAMNFKAKLDSGAEKVAKYAN